MTVKLTKVGDWEVARFSLETGARTTAPMIKKSLRQEAAWLRKVVVQGIRRQRPGGKQFAPLSPNTIAVRRFLGFRGRKALIRNGDLIGAVTTKSFSGGFGAFVGVLKNAKDSDGQKLVNVARVLEEGAGPFVVQLTDKMRRFFFAALDASGIKRNAPSGPRPSGPSTPIVIIKIPARPFLQPVFDKVASKPEVVRARMLSRLAINMKGVMGKPTQKPPK